MASAAQLYSHAAMAARNQYRPPGVEPGVTGKERTFQQSRQFGPGPIKPYPYSKPPPLVNNRRVGNGVYYGSGRTGTRRTGTLRKGEQRA